MRSVGEDKGWDGDFALLSGPAEDLGSSSSGTERLKCTRSNVERRVTGGDDGDDDQCVDDAGSSRNASTLECDGEGRSGGLGLGTKELRVVGRNVEGDEEDRAQVEDEDTVEDGPDRNRNCLAWILGLCCGQGNTLAPA